MEIRVTSWQEIQNTCVYDVISLLLDPSISDDDHLKHENIFCAKKYKSKILTKL